MGRSVSEVAHRFVLIAEDRINARTAAVLVDRVLAESVSVQWLRDLWSVEQRNAARAWIALDGDPGEAFDHGRYSKLDHLEHIAPTARTLRRGVGGKAATVVKAVQAIELTSSADGSSAALIAMDSDESREERAAMEQAFDAQRSLFAQDHPGCALLLAIASPESEAWCIAAIDDPAPFAAVLAALREELGFDPRARFDRLTSTSAASPRDCKRAFERLFADRDSDAARDVLHQTPLEGWIARGESCGVRALADDVHTTLTVALTRR